MATYFDLDKCQWLCSCKRSNPLCNLYFCRHCLDLRCTQCVSHEVDSHYCPHCLENMASAEAKMRKHRCGNCFDCPSCGNTLSTRATVVVSAKPEDPGKVATHKAYFLACGFCRWSTRDSGIADQPQFSGGWQDHVSPDFKRISELIDSYHLLAVREKADQEWSKFVRKRNYMLLLERYPVLNPRLKRYSTSPRSTASRDAESTKNVVIPSAIALSELPEFDLDSFINQPLCLNKLTKIHERLMATQTQPTQVEKLLPIPKHLMVKRSMRCRVCEHNLSKPDFNPSSIKFRINLNAIYHVPEIRHIIQPIKGELKSNETKILNQRHTSVTFNEIRSKPVVYSQIIPDQLTNIILVICNPAHRITTLSLRQLTLEEEQTCLGDLIRDLHTHSSMDNMQSKISTDDPKAVDSTGDTDKSAKDQSTLCFSTVKLNLPDQQLKLAPRDDIADYDESLSQGSLGEIKDDPNLVAFRRGNRLGINVGLTANFKPPEKHILSTIDEVNECGGKSNLVPLRAAVYISFDYKNTTSTLLSEQRAAAATANIKPQIDSTVSGRKKSETKSTEQTNINHPEEVNQIQLIALLEFGNMAV